jgi:hypothetical protein
VSLYLSGVVLDIVVIVLGFALSLYTAVGFFKAGKFKATASRDTMLQAGFGWIEKISLGTVRLIAWAEIVGAVVLVAAPLVYLVGIDLAIWFAVAAGVGLALTMVGAIVVHAQRGESKYTLKMNLKLLAVAVLSAVAWAVLPLL